MAVGHRYELGFIMPEYIPSQSEIAYDMSDMATLIREEEERLFGTKVETIKAYCAEHDQGKLLNSELITCIQVTING
jgi:hypothetical protein